MRASASVDHPVLGLFRLHRSASTQIMGDRRPDRLQSVMSSLRSSKQNSVDRWLGLLDFAAKAPLTGRCKDWTTVASCCEI